MELGLFVVGIAIGLVISSISIRKHSVGSLRIDRSDIDDNPYLFLEIKRDVADLEKRKIVILKVRCENFISHE